MITVEMLIGYSSFWHKIIPFESNYLKYNCGDSALSSEVASVDSSEWDLIAETAFLLATGEYSAEMASEVAGEKISGLRRDGNSDISENGLEIARLLSGLILDQVSTFFALSEVVWRPYIPGLGALLPSEADAYSGATVIEIKNVDRAFRSRDLRQVLIYCAALSSSGIDVNSFLLANPRKDLYIRSNLNSACQRMSGRPWMEVRSEIESLLLSMNYWLAGE